jgi:hypothetical protein
MTEHLPAPDAIALETLGLDSFETGLLAVLRHLLTAYARPESQAWQTAFELAAQRWGLARGPQVAMGLLPVLQALRGARRADFEFANPLCLTCRHYATETEAAFLRMVQAMRHDRPDLARPAVLALAEGRMDPGLIQAGLAFAARFPAEPGTRPPLPSDQEQPDAGSDMRPGRRHLRLVH